MAQLPPECRQAIVQLADDDGNRRRDASCGLGDETVSVDRRRRVAGRVRGSGAGDGPDRGGRRPGQPQVLCRPRCGSSTLPGLIRPTRGRSGPPGRGTAAGRPRRCSAPGPTGPFVLDLAQGPHLLVAGTTGSGKSELLQTLVASLAVANRPDAMNFVLDRLQGWRRVPRVRRRCRIPSGCLPTSMNSWWTGRSPRCVRNCSGARPCWDGRTRPISSGTGTRCLCMADARSAAPPGHRGGRVRRHGREAAGAVEVAG